MNQIVEIFNGELIEFGFYCRLFRLYTKIGDKIQVNQAVLEDRHECKPITAIIEVSQENLTKNYLVELLDNYRDKSHQNFGVWISRDLDLSGSVKAQSQNFHVKFYKIILEKNLISKANLW